MDVLEIEIAAEFVTHAQRMLGQTILKGALQDTGAPHRKTFEFGYNFARMKDGDFTYTKIPDFLYALCGQAIHEMEKKREARLPHARFFQNCIVSIYQSGSKLEPHIDADRNRATKYGNDFYFGEYIIGVVLKADTKGGLYLADSTDRKELETGLVKPEPLNEANGSAFLLHGRSRECYHGVSEIENYRISATYRIVHSINKGLLLAPKN